MAHEQVAGTSYRRLILRGLRYEPTESGTVLKPATDDALGGARVGWRLAQAKLGIGYVCPGLATGTVFAISNDARCARGI